MLKKYVFALGILLCGTAVVRAQNQERRSDGEGVVVLKVHDPASSRSIVTDARGQFVFTRYDLKGQAARDLWKVEKGKNVWKEAGSSSGPESDLLLVAGQTDLNAVQPGSAVQAVYWEDASGTTWCLANSGVTLMDPLALGILLSGTPPVLDRKNNEELTGWVGKFPIRIQYK